ncbi:MAG: alkaline phosphatase family protein, partial [Vicinamibacterales bacterium]
MMPQPIGRRRRSIALVAAVLLAAWFSGPVSGQPGRTPADPALIVILVIDQMRADYVDRFQRDWTGGLKRIFTSGARFTNAAYPYLATYTCAGHATIGTGTLPYVHGIFQNEWYDRERKGNMPCTDDPGAAPVGYTGRPGSYGPRLLKVPTFADEMRAQRSSRVVSLALKARSAIMLAGHGGDAVSWMTGPNDGWQTSTAFAAAPVPAVKAYVEAHPVEADYGRTWTLALPPARYAEPDDGEAEYPRPGWSRTFPHPLVDPTGAPGKQFYDLWQHSPFADQYVARMAAGLVDAFELGQRSTTDVLLVSFSTPDLVGHQYGPDSLEIHDIYVRLDRTIGDLLDHLDARVGRDRWVMAVSADHGVTPIPEQQARRGLDVGRLRSATVRGIVQAALERAWGPGEYAARVTTNDVYFHPGVYDRLRADRAAFDGVTKALLSQPGIERVLRSEEVEGQIASADPFVRAAALSYVRGHSGDLILVTRPGWMFATFA